MKPVPPGYPHYHTLITCKLLKDQNERHTSSGQQSCQQLDSTLLLPVAFWAGQSCQETCTLYTYLGPLFHRFKSVGLLSPGQHKPSRSSSQPVPWRGKWWAVVTRVAFWCALDKGLPVLLGDESQWDLSGSLLPSGSQAWLGNSF